MEFVNGPWGVVESGMTAVCVPAMAGGSVERPLRAIDGVSGAAPRRIRRGDPSSGCSRPSRVAAAPTGCRLVLRLDYFVHFA